MRLKSKTNVDVISQKLQTNHLSNTIDPYNVQQQVEGKMFKWICNNLSGPSDC